MVHLWDGRHGRGAGSPSRYLRIWAIPGGLACPLTVWAVCGVRGSYAGGAAHRKAGPAQGAGDRGPHRTEAGPLPRLFALSGISYLFAGENRRDYVCLKSLLGMEKVILAGCGHINGSFLQNGVIDEVILVIA